MIAGDISLSQRLARALEHHPDFDVLTQSLSITTFRYVPGDLRRTAKDDAYLNELNAALLAALQRGGEVFVSNAVIHGRYALRACIVNFHTAGHDVDAVPAIVAAHGARIDEQMRATTGRGDVTPA
jgi:glutamate/tyrosine decarboxylase-like PLP-dependent enzyme